MFALTTASTVMAALAVAGGAALLGCGGKLPETRYYQLSHAAPPAAPSEIRTESPLIVLEPLVTETAYDDERIVYRTNPYRLDYYQYHRWSASPGVLVAGFLEEALERTGKFRGVVRELSVGAAAVVGGRVVAIEEVDVSRTEWRGRIVLELTVTDATKGGVLWSQQFSEIEPLREQTPEGLARALSAAMSRIVARAAPEIAEVASRAVVASEGAPTSPHQR